MTLVHVGEWRTELRVNCVLLLAYTFFFHLFGYCMFVLPSGWRFLIQIALYTRIFNTRLPVGWWFCIIQIVNCLVSIALIPLQRLILELCVK